MKILLGVDGSGCSEVAMKEVAARPWPSGSVVRVLYVLEPIVFPALEAVQMPESYCAAREVAAREELKGVVRELKGNASRGLEIEWEMIPGSAAQVILCEAEEWGADLIVVGSHGRGRLGSFVLGSASQAVALHAKCSVKIVRERKSRDSRRK